MPQRQRQAGRRAGETLKTAPGLYTGLGRKQTVWGKGFAAKPKGTGKGNQHRCPIEGAACDAMWASGLSRRDRQTDKREELR